MGAPAERTFHLPIHKLGISRYLGRPPNEPTLTTAPNPCQLTNSQPSQPHKHENPPITLQGSPISPPPPPPCYLHAAVIRRSKARRARGKGRTNAKRVCVVVHTYIRHTQRLIHTPYNTLKKKCATLVGQRLHSDAPPPTRQRRVEHHHHHHPQAPLADGWPGAAAGAAAVAAAGWGSGWWWPWWDRAAAAASASEGSIRMTMTTAVEEVAGTSSSRSRCGPGKQTKQRGRRRREEAVQQ